MAVRNQAARDVMKVWLYAIGTVLLGALLAPWIYNAGKALAEVSSVKQTNDAVEWLAQRCGRASFGQFYQLSLLLAAAVLLLPLVEWLRARRGAFAGARPWSLRLPDAAWPTDHGQRLLPNRAAAAHFCLGFFTLFGLLVIVHGMHLMLGDFTWQNPAQNIVLAFAKWAALAFLMAALQELIFRGIVMGIFMRAMRPAAALGLSALLFAAVHFMIPASGLHVADPEASGTGFEMLGIVLTNFAEVRPLISQVIPWLVLGGVLAFGRWRTASLWLPIGIHAGWIFSAKLSQEFTLVTQLSASSSRLMASDLLQQGLLPVVALLITGVFIHYLTVPAADAAATPSD
jgi:uncharacterized protein